MTEKIIVPWVDDAKSYVTGMPINLKDTWHWWSAVWAFDYGDRETLAELIRNEEIPLEYKKVVASIVSGDRKPNLKASVKSKVKPTDRAEILNAYYVFAGLRDSLKTDVERIFSKNKKSEPIELMRKADTLSNRFFRMINENCGISDEAIKKIIREGKERLRKFPEM